MHSKVMPLSEAIARFVPDGSKVVTGTYMEQKIPFAAAHEIIRQKKRDLVLVGPISDILFDQLIGAGCVQKVMAAWVGNVMMGSAYAFRRAVEEGIPRKVDVVDYTNFTMSLALQAAALGVPFLPTRSTLGTSILAENEFLVAFDSPVSPDRLVAVKAIHPDVAIVHLCQCDPNGNGLAWGNTGVTAAAVAASEKVIVLTEELVDAEFVQGEPNLVLFPGFRVSAVCHVPLGCHPSPVLGYYERDHQVFREYHEASRTREGLDRWLAEWVYQVADQKGYLEKLGPGRVRKLRPRGQAKGGPILAGAQKHS